MLPVGGGELRWRCSSPRSKLVERRVLVRAGARGGGVAVSWLAASRVQASRKSVIPALTEGRRRQVGALKVKLSPHRGGQEVSVVS
jgi:hypothetical protein